jgi:hypothetical protein
MVGVAVQLPPQQRLERLRQERFNRHPNSALHCPPLAFFIRNLPGGA